MYKVVFGSNESDAMEFTSVMSTKVERAKDYVDDMVSLWPVSVWLGVYDTKKAEIVYQKDGEWKP